MQNEKRVRLACYTTNITMSVVGNLSPLLFLTFRSLFGVSYSLLGLLVLVNCCTQLLVDLFFSFFFHKLNIPKIVKFTPALSVVGLILFATLPTAFPQFAYLGLLVGTFVFSASSGLAEVLMSPVIAALPSDNPERDMSKLHSIYAWGVVGVVIVTTLFLLAFGKQYWYVLSLLLAVVPLVAYLLFFGAKLPVLQTPERASGVKELCKKKELWLCVFAIFLGGASECTMSQWCSGYLEQALGIDKVLGDVFGVALFAMTLGLGRTLYAKFGKNVEKILFLGGLGALVCYLTAAVSPSPIVGLMACALTGFCVSMLWPGSLIAAADAVPQGGVFLYAMMAAGGDFGASVGPQLVGVVTDTVSQSAWALRLSKKWGLTAETLGLRFGMALGALFPLVSVFAYLTLLNRKKKAVKGLGINK